VEIKLPVAGAEEARRRLAKIGARRVRSVHEFNVVYDTEERRLFHSGRLLRLRVEMEPGRDEKCRRAVLTYKGPARGENPGAEGAVADALVPGRRYKIREELETEISSPETLEAVFAGLGLLPWFRYEKNRTSFLPRAARKARKGAALHIELDETPIGVFLELEGEPRAIDDAARRLGYRTSEYVTASYWGLYMAHCQKRGIPPGDMLFPRKK